MMDRRPAEIFPPGEFLRDELDARGWTQSEFAKIIGRPARVVNEVIAGKRGITPETAMDFAAAFGTSAQFWMNLESAYQLYRAAPAHERLPRDERIAREAKLRERFPVRELVKRRWVEDSENFDVLESRVFAFYGIASFEEEPRLAHAAKRSFAEDLPAVQLAWLFRVKQLASATQTPRYSAKKLLSAIDSLGRLTTEPEEIRHVPAILHSCGVRFVIVEPMPGSKIDGACFWLDDEATPVIGLTLRQDRIDNFWFVLRHEIEHVLREDGKDEPVIDETDENGLLTSSATEAAEEAANAAAADFCVPADEMVDFINRVHPMYSERKIIGFARRVQRHPGLVIGQIQNKTRRYDLLRKYLVKVRQIIVQSNLTDGYGVAVPLSASRS